MIYELELPGTPPSMNAVGVGSSKAWQRSARVKKQWEGDCVIALLYHKVPKRLTKVHATAVLTFPSKRRRDEGNYRAVLEKALGDALQLGWIPDDTPEHFTFGEVTFAEETGKAQTLVRLEVENG